jgi:hypothetical protein
LIPIVQAAEAIIGIKNLTKCYIGDNDPNEDEDEDDEDDEDQDQDEDGDIVQDEDEDYENVGADDVFEYNQDTGQRIIRRGNDQAATRGTVIDEDDPFDDDGSALADDDEDDEFDDPVDDVPNEDDPFETGNEDANWAS